MSNYNFDFKIDKSKGCSIGFSKYGITFKKTIINALGCPQKICIGIDKRNKALAVVADNPNIDGEGKRFNFVTDERKKKLVIIQSAPIRHTIEKMLGKELDKKIVYYNVKVLEIDNVKTFIVDFNKENNNE